MNVLPSLFTAPRNPGNNRSSVAKANPLSPHPIRRRASTPDSRSVRNARNVEGLEGHRTPTQASNHQKGSTLRTVKNESWKSGSGAEQDSALKRPRSASSVDLSDSIRVRPHKSLARGKKRRFPANGQSSVELEQQPPSKKTRIRIRPRHTLDPLAFSKGLAQENLPSSPLFFSSHNSRQRPPLLLRYSSSEAGATMLSKANLEDSAGIRTVKMARGSLNIGSSPPQGIGTPNRRGSAERYAMCGGGTPDEKQVSSAHQALNQVGITELLEQDDRPTFIVDLKNQANFQPGPLQTIYANSSLRSYAGLLDMITGKASYDSPGLASTFPEFKAWSTSFVKNSESLDVCLPSFLYGGITWSCSTLRKRLRLINGSAPSGPTSVGTSAPSVDFLGPLSTTFSHANGSSRISSGEARPKVDEPKNDYFGNAQVSITAGKTVVSSGKKMLPTVESPDPSLKVMDNGTPMQDIGEDASVHVPSDPYSTDVSPLGTHPIKATNVDSFNDPHNIDLGFFDWTRLAVTSAMPRHVQFARTVDWASTSLGPIEDWPPALRGMCNLIMASPHPAAMYWGDDFVVVYNEAYILLAGQKHPQLMGQKYSEAWHEIWHLLVDVFTEAKLTGQSTMKDDDCLFITRSGFLEETYFSWSIIPLVGEDGSVVGLYNPCFEKTRRKIAERRMLTLREVGEQTAAARELKSFWGKVLKGLEYNDYDTPFALLYSVTDDSESDGSSMHSSSGTSNKQCILEGTLGVPEGHKAAPLQIDLRFGIGGFGRVMREAMTTDQPVLLETETGTLDVNLIEGFDFRGWGDPCRAAVVCPIHPTTGDAILGFLIMGINPRRPYDDDYSLFVHLLSRQIATAMASVVLFEEEIRRGQQAAQLAARDRIELSEQLAARTKEAVESETKFTRMAEFAPVGMFIADSEGRITYCNDTWYEISRHPKEENSTDNWMDSVKDEDKTMVIKLWSSLVQDKVPMNAEFRFKTPWSDRNGVKGDTWVLASAYPERSQDGSLKSVFGSITNISQQKWAEDFQKRRREEAVELKRQQENFIDITSHEMRNPLSAILQCADEISSSLIDFKTGNTGRQPTPELLDSNIDAAQIIALCANHQKRIVDDILTLSKLDSALLLVTPVDVQPVTVVQRALKMFEGEIQTADIKMEFKVDQSISDLKIDWVKLDPSRLLQVLINLTTNAIKFTTTEAKRTIIVTLSAHLDRPSTKEKHTVNYFPTRSKRADLTDATDWGDGDEVYIHFAVQDTGRGLSDDEMKLLFHRFSQASPRTHVQYGGSGLGLFISRELVELQGGAIGVASESGIGSTFAFYVKARRSTTPKDVIEQLPSASGGRNSYLGKMGKPLANMNSSNGTSPTPAQPTITNQDLKVLIVEDNLVNQRVLQKQLRNIGCTVYVANHGGECIDRLKESTFWKGHGESGLELSVVLMDQEMPVMDGLTCTRKIRELQGTGEVTRHVPIIAVTANARDKQIDQLLLAGMDDVVSKPFRIPELVPKMKDLVTKHNLKIRN